MTDHNTQLDLSIEIKNPDLIPKINDVTLNIIISTSTTEFGTKIPIFKSQDFTNPLNNAKICWGKMIANNIIFFILIIGP